MVKYKLALLLLVFLTGFLIRFYRFNGPVADWHSWRQADTSSVSRNFVNNGFDLLHPRFDDLSNVPSGLDNPQGYRFVEFPIYNSVQAGLFKIFGVLTIEEWGRLVTIFASLLSSVFLYLIVKKRFGFKVSILTSSFFLFLPFNIYYSRTILPDPSMVMAVLGGIYFFDKWLERKKLSILNFNFFLSLTFVTCAFLIKPYALFFTLPMVYLAYEKFGLSFFKKWQLYLLLISVLPLIFWRNWITQFPEGIPASNWLFNGNHIRFRPSFFYWIFYKRLFELILGYFGIIIFAFSFLKKYKNKELLFVLSFVLSSVVYTFVLATGNVQHDYYQILIIPSISIILGIGSVVFYEKLEKIHKFLGSLALILIIVLSFSFSWNLVKDYFNINNSSIIKAGIAVDKLIPKNAKIVAPYGGDTSFLYQTKRKGWASFEKPLPELIKMGAQYLVLVNPKPEDYGIGKEYEIISSSKDYILFDLNKKP